MSLLKSSVAEKDEENINRGCINEHTYKETAEILKNAGRGSGVCWLAELIFRHHFATSTQLLTFDLSDFHGLFLLRAMGTYILHGQFKSNIVDLTELSYENFRDLTHQSYTSGAD